MLYLARATRLRTVGSHAGFVYCPFSLCTGTLHVHSGIAQLKKAAQRGVTFRMMILFMILMLSFSLLFLDWYTP